ncbi:MAG: methylenetetrahydrofolate reductase [NAD(P)H] [Chromatiales bacterium]|jgi:methylenetetrahydrofolate reductase (NADPH)|nr:methylenetetrahydrofolate reductase [NAD(P)H] [Chromatiales bacterium]
MNHDSPLNKSVNETSARLRARPRQLHHIDSMPKVSFEFFPPATEAMERTLWDAIEALSPLSPQFVSVTYGAGGSTRERTHATVQRVATQTELQPAAHLTCIGASRTDLDTILDDYYAAGVRHIVALRGDPPDGASRHVHHPDGYHDAAQLTAAITARGGFEVSVGCYPETHPEARSPAADIDFLKRKIDAGATRAITQFFFDADVFFRFYDRARAAGIDIPIVPGILPVTNFAKLVQFADRCGTTIPDWLAVLFEGLDDAPDIRQLVAATAAAELCTRLSDQGIGEFHFYTLNRAELTRAICQILGLRPATPNDAVVQTGAASHA